MKHSPLFLSLSLVASFSLLPISAASSASDIQVNRAKTASNKAKTVKATSVKTQANVSKATTALKPEPLKLATSDLPKSFPVAAGGVTTNPYFANQPAAILPLSARPVPSTAAATAVAVPTNVPPAPVAAISVAPIATPETIAVAAPASVTPVVAAPAPTAVPAAPFPVALPSLEPPNYAAAVYAAPTPVAVNPFKAPVVAYPTWNGTPAGYKNPYLSYQAQPIKVQDTIKSFSDFGSGFKFAWPSLPQLPQLPQFPNPAAALPAAPATSIAVTQVPAQVPAQVYVPAQVKAQQAAPQAANQINSLFASLKMMLPLTGDANILPTIKKVYPTGEKPLVVLNFKCPTEVIGITPPPMKLLHEAVNLGFDGLNKTNLLSFNLQQVCS
jgi:hypothetical protein